MLDAAPTFPSHTGTQKTSPDDEQRLSFNQFLSWRGIDPSTDVVCKKCSGSGVASYGSSCTWHVGIGGQMMTQDVCDKCWGSGVTNRPGVNLRQLQQNSNKATKELI